MASLVDAVVFVASSPGTGAFVVSAALTGWRTPAAAGAVDGATYRYRAYSTDQIEWEVGTGVYTVGTTTLTRGVILASSNGGSAVNFTGAPNVALTAFAADWPTAAQLAKVDFLTVTQAVDLDTLESDVAASKTKTDFLTVTQAVDLDTLESDVAASKTKTDFLTVTASTDLDAIRTTVSGLGTASTKNTGTGSGQVPVLDGSGRLDTAVLPSIAITDIFVVASEAAMLALSAEKGDIAIRTDQNKSYGLSTNSPGTLADWKELLTPTDAVLSVAGLTGAISAGSLKTALAIAQADVSGLTTASTPLFAGVDLGNADTTLSRSAAGVLAVEGVVVPTISSTNTLTNKRYSPRVTTITSSATPTVNTDNTDVVNITALAEAITSMTTNLSGTPGIGDVLIFQIKDNGTARAITWGASFTAKGVALPTTTVINKLLTVGFVWNGSNWGCVGSSQEA